MYYDVSKDLFITILFSLTIFIFVCATRSLLFLAVALFSRTPMVPRNVNTVHFNNENTVDSLQNNLSKGECNFAFRDDMENGCDNGHTRVNNDPNSTCGTVLSPFSNSALPFVSVLIASYNENVAIEKLLLSLSHIKYDFDRFEIIIVDDSTDGTVDILREWTEKLCNLKVIHRERRDGWKGGALNTGIDNLDKESDIVLVVDADNVLRENILKQIALSFVFLQCEKKDTTFVIQGYLISTVNVKGVDFMKQRSKTQDTGINFNATNYATNNWVSRGISFRLCQRNLIEFIAKDKLGLPLPLTGSLFAIKTNILKSIRFSNDLCEDWDLTLDIYLSNHIFNKNKHTTKNSYDPFNDDEKKHFRNYTGFLKSFCNNVNYQNTISFDPDISSFTESTKKGKAYFNQRKRVSEGHTRGFKKRITKILKNNRLSFIYKIELLLMGLRYAKYIPLLCLIVLDFLFFINMEYIYNLKDISINLLLGLQGLSLFIYMIYNTISIKLFKRNKKRYYFKDMLCLLLLNIYTIPAFVYGSFLGLVRDKGSFYRTARNESTPA